MAEQMKSKPTYIAADTAVVNLLDELAHKASPNGGGSVELGVTASKYFIGGPQVNQVVSIERPGYRWQMLA